MTLCQAASYGSTTAQQQNNKTKKEEDGHTQLLKAGK